VSAADWNASIASAGLRGMPEVGDALALLRDGGLAPMSMLQIAYVSTIMQHYAQDHEDATAQQLADMMVERLRGIRDAS